MATCPVSAWSDRERFISTITCRDPRCGAVFQGTSRAPAHDRGLFLDRKCLKPRSNVLSWCAYVHAQSIPNMRFPFHDLATEGMFSENGVCSTAFVHPLKENASRKDCRPAVFCAPRAYGV